MALLRATGRASGLKWATAGMLVTLLGGCALYEALVPGEPRYAFSHARHVVDEGLACEDCHAPSEEGGLPSMPVAAQCNLCHQELDAEKPPERRIEVLLDGNKVKASRRGGLGGDVIFAHGQHLGAGLECASCHSTMETNTDVLTLPRAQMASCTDCHVERQLASDCATCHRQIRSDVAPAGHDALWTRTHGMTVRAGHEDTASDCSLCHTESSCTACHLSVMPQSHTDYWRRRAHGISASLDRSSCMTCHRDDSCVRCHSESRPSSHVGNFGGVTSRHCTGCHFPLEGESCATCHRATPSHDLATPKPPDHLPSMDCRMCHGAGQPLPHVDNGDNCNICHR